MVRPVCEAGFWVRIGIQPLAKAGRFQPPQPVRS